MSKLLFQCQQCVNQTIYAWKKNFQDKFPKKSWEHCVCKGSLDIMTKFSSPRALQTRCTLSNFHPPKWLFDKQLNESSKNVSQLIPVVVKRNFQTGSHCQNLEYPELYILQPYRQINVLLASATIKTTLKTTKKNNPHLILHHTATYYYPKIVN